MTAAVLSKPELFERLAQGRAAGVTVVTPNRRLAQVLKAEFDAFQSGKGLAVWDDADILPLEAFATRCYEDALYAEGGRELPTLLSSAQSRALWEEAIRASRWAGALLDVPRTAADAMDAWRLAQAWRIAGGLEKFAATEDTQAFADWAREYARRCAKGGFLDAAGLYDLEPGGGIRRPGLLVAYAFDIVPAQVEAYLSRFEFRHGSPEKKPARVVRTSFASPREELEAAARWARAQLEAGRQRIGIVVPDLSLRRREAARVFSRTLGSPLAVELSVGEPLAAHPLVACALQLLEFTAREIPFEDASRLVRSPFLGGAEGERAARARLDARLRREAPAQLSLARLIGLADGCPALRRHLEKVYALKGDRHSPHDWAQHFTALLEAAGFPGERAVDSAEYQARAKFNDMLGEFARLGLLSLRLSLPEALRHLRRLCADTLFQPEGVGAPVQVLGLIESAGLAFDALWVSGLTDGAWPQRARPEPFLPLALQRKAGIPEASAEASLALDRRRTAAWATAAGEVVFSWARQEDDRELSPSPLIAEVPEGSLDLPVFPSWRELIFGRRTAEAFADDRAPPFAAAAVHGGSSVLKDQAACPFRAFARHRLGARALESPEPGLDALARGNLLHALMAAFWREAKTKAALEGDVSALVARCAESAVRELRIEGPFAELEKRRLIRLAGDWLDVERARAAFEVVHVEEKRPVVIGGLALSVRIDRMDRLLDGDLPGDLRGSYALIDYKTGNRVTPNDWAGDRPADPQLPLYAVTAAENVTALAFAKLRAGDMKFAGSAERKGVLPGVSEAKSWSGLRQGWKAALEGLAAGFAAGEARVDPKKGLATCRNCDLQPLCRVHERLSALGDGEGEG